MSASNGSGGFGRLVTVLGGGTVASAVVRLLSAAGFSAVDRGFIAGRDAALVICALEGVPASALAEIDARCRAAGVPCLFVVTGGRELQIGPLVQPGRPGCLACLPPPAAIPEATAELVFAAQLAAAVVLREAHRLLVVGGQGELAGKLLTLDARGRRRLGPAAPAAGCRVCAAAVQAGGTILVTAADFQRAMAEFAPAPRLRVTTPAARRVGILGGGTAGYLTALALRRKLPGVEVTLIESSDIPIIGVGEATTPLLPALLHGTLGLDMADFFRRAEPTLKLGIHFDWGRPDGPGFHYPFDRGPLLESYHYEGHVNAYCPTALAMSAERSNLLRLADGSLRFLPAPFAYHIDNRRFVDYLRQEAARAGVEHLDRRIQAAAVAQDGETVRHLVTDRGEHLSYDLLVDCSGFRSFLLGETLGVEELSFTGSLFTDTALAAATPHGGRILSHTRADTLDCGWGWSIAQPEADHVGYVFSSAHCSVEAARAELARRYPQLTEPRVVRFRPGRRQLAWKGNVVAVGNSYGFVEPLESTSLHMVGVTIVLLLQHFPAADEPRSRALFNRYLGDFWDQLRWFLALHFKFNRRRDTPFWRDCREQADVSGAAETLDLFRERAPLSARPHLASYDALWGDFGRDVILLGQDVPGTLTPPRQTPEQWAHTKRQGELLAAAALPGAEALALLQQRPELLARLQSEAPWLQDAAVGGRVGW